MATSNGLQLGRKIAPVRFLIFMGLAIVGAIVAIPPLGWRVGSMASFDCAAIVFLASIWSLLCSKPDQMRETAKANDANRAALLLITLIVSMTVLVAVASELSQKGDLKPVTVALIVGTLALCWVFSNTIYALHYAHLFYTWTTTARAIAAASNSPRRPSPIIGISSISPSAWA